VAATAIDAIGSNAVNSVAPLQGRGGTDVCTEAPVYSWTMEQPVADLSRRIAGFARERAMKDVQAILDQGRLSSIQVGASNAHGRPTRMRLIDHRGMTAELSAENFRRAANWSGETGTNGSVRVKPADKDLLSSNVQVTIQRSMARFHGRGFGHGVGLCQYGSEVLAKAGTSHADILGWYYPAVQLVRGYG
jgi:SpoIID/LytB domain protein